MSASDPATPPAWAISMAIDFANKASGGNSIDLALLLASVREGALREARIAAEAATVFSDRAKDVVDAVRALLTTPPGEATR